MSDVKIWLVTGASTGFGRAMTDHLLEIGNRVIATLRQPDTLADLSARYPPTQLLVAEVDVTKPADVIAAFSKAQQTFGRIDVVFNNAGVHISGEVESVDEAQARNVFEVNLWGAARVSREAVRFFREVNKPAGGRLLQVSSRLGLVGGAAQGFYSASKFALEGLTESLVDELDPVWNIKATILEAGPYRTQLIGKNQHTAPQHPAYADPTLRASQVRKFIATPALFDGDVTKAAIIIEKLSRLEDPPLRFPLHKRTVASMRDKAKDLLEVADKYESWNVDLYHDD